MVVCRLQKTVPIAIISNELEIIEQIITFLRQGEVGVNLMPSKNQSYRR